jgi:xanthine dehydrogenase accessory factor
MKHWNETGEIVDRVTGLAAAGRRAAIATAVRITGSSYRRPGAKFLVDDEGCTLGAVSGGCLEADVREIALGVMSTGTSRLVHYETGSDDRTVFGLGLGCNGSVDIFIHSATGPGTIEILRTAQVLLKHDAASFAIATVVDAPDEVGRSLIVDAGTVLAGSLGGPDLDRDVARLASAGLADGRSCLHEIDGRLVFTDVLCPPPRLIVCGAGDDARPIVACAVQAGFAVTVVDHRPGYLAAARFPSARRLLELRPGDDLAPLDVGAETFIVVKTHSFAQDREWVRGFLQAGAAYVGLLGPRARRDEILGQLGVANAQVFGPVGLDIGADGPEQIAISIVAEMLAFRSRCAGGHLRQKAETIHAV